MTRPTFINIGPGRCATSWLFEVLKAHPEIGMANVKETEFFNSNFSNGIDWYEKHFQEPGKAVGEISNCYYLEPSVAKRIHDYHPEMKILINVRDPYTLMQSFHGFGLRRGIELGPLTESLDAPIGRLMGSGYSYRERRGILNPGDKHSLLDSVMLSCHLKPFIELFPDDQVYFVIYERMRDEQTEVLREIYEFLGVDSDFVPADAEKVVNASITPKSKMVARLATNVSYVLRRAGAYGLLSRLHQSRLIKRIFYSDSTKKSAPKVDPREVLDKESKILLDEEIQAMMQLHPPLTKWWKSLLPEDSYGPVKV